MGKGKEGRGKRLKRKEETGKEVRRDWKEGGRRRLEGEGKRREHHKGRSDGVIDKDTEHCLHDGHTSHTAVITSRVRSAGCIALSGDMPSTQHQQTIIFL